VLETVRLTFRCLALTLNSLSSRPVATTYVLVNSDSRATHRTTRNTLPRYPLTKTRRMERVTTSSGCYGLRKTLVTDWTFHFLVFISLSLYMGSTSHVFGPGLINYA
jgi:hypothetical protein